MKRTSRCLKCNWLLEYRSGVCPCCGQTIPGYVFMQLPEEHPESSPHISGQGVLLERTKPDEVFPKTIQELLSFCNQNGMPLEKMRFFIGVD